MDKIAIINADEARKISATNPPLTKEQIEQDIANVMSAIRYTAKSGLYQVAVALEGHLSLGRCTIVAERLRGLGYNAITAFVDDSKSRVIIEWKE